MINERHEERVNIAIDIVQHQRCSTCYCLFNLQNGRRVTKGQTKQQQMRKVVTSFQEHHSQEAPASLIGVSLKAGEGPGGPDPHLIFSEIAHFL